MRNEDLVVRDMIDELLEVPRQIILNGYLSLAYVVHHHWKDLLARLADRSSLNSLNRMEVVILMRTNHSFPLSLHPNFLVSLG